MLRVLTIFLAMALSACATTGMYDAPKGEQTVKLTVDNQLSAASDSADQGGWQMPGQSSPVRAAIFTVDEDRVAEQAGLQSITLEPGKHKIQVFADRSGILRFGTFRYKFKEAGDYTVSIGAGDGTDKYELKLINQAAPDKVLVKKDF
ncbi:hypothetical protein A11A3_06470 [Alcanivorax hongdengensis A-11-3]|uniref:Lipoprotein n=1 Tax=Alcanivorax hongdengensis A-11-3 TaxID=1177179 RepID=L0WGA7_9GAMM|nr:hypothetical protein [Alcanivorax hongdengensis]EKF74855.1 hypothetical protein A11A3_06470 [Alcanivorax hongdengensis A-11-3]